MDAKELKPCPMCGAAPKLIVGFSPLDHAFVDCECGMQTELKDKADEVVAMWNRRAALPSDAAQEPVAVIGSGWQLLYTSGDSLSAIVERHGLKIGSTLYAAPVAAQTPLTDEQRSTIQRAADAAYLALRGNELRDTGLRNELSTSRYALLALLAAPVAPAAAARPEPFALRFPTVLRKMWSGREVQAWLDELPSLYEAPPVAHPALAALAQAPALVERAESIVSSVTAATAAQPDERASCNRGAGRDGVGECFAAHHGELEKCGRKAAQPDERAALKDTRINELANNACYSEAREFMGKAKVAARVDVEKAIREALREASATAPQAGATLTDEQRDAIMEQAQVFASAWSLIGGVFDSGNALETAEQEKANLRALLAAHPAEQLTDSELQRPGVQVMSSLTGA